MRGLSGVVVFALIFLLGLHGAQPSLKVSGGITLNGVAQPLLFTWNSPVPIGGAGWAPGELVQVVLLGPLDTTVIPVRRGRSVLVQDAGEFAPRMVRGGRPLRAGVPRLTAADLPIGMFPADAQGNLSAAPVIPFDSGIVGPQARIPRPGYYEVRAVGSVSGTVVAAERINLCPDTYNGGKAGSDWGHERGGRDGVFPDPFRQFSPERFDPEWPSVWDERPVTVYGTVAAPDHAGAGQPAQISPSDNPPTHYAHDAIFFLVPDEPYRWVVGTANYYNADAGSPELGRLEVEWEALNGGSTANYGSGKIGVPLWANPTAGDHVFAVGRWILDAGHPELGDRTEIHPPRLLATMRNRPAVLNGSAASEVDIYVSGHGGGANFMPPGLSAILSQNGWGGGRIRDVLSAADQDRYYRPGPLSPLLAPLLAELVRQLAGISLTATVYPDAGPSAFPWGAPGAEERRVNDTDYDFDVPLPARPPDATTVTMEATTRPEHTTALREVVTYTGPANGPPTTAHIHLPYRGADNGIYARSLKFAWAQAPAPAGHWTVRLNRIDVTGAAGKWQLWADISGQWRYLSGAAPALLNTSAGQSVNLAGVAADVYADKGQTVRVYVHGYRAACLDDFFGKLFGQSSYVAGLGFVAQCGPTDNQDLGGAVLELPAQPSPVGTYTVPATDDAGNHYFSVAISVEAP